MDAFMMSYGDSSGPFDAQFDLQWVAFTILEVSI